jgi:hypothetical protein
MEMPQTHPITRVGCSLSSFTYETRGYLLRAFPHFRPMSRYFGVVDLVRSMDSSSEAFRMTPSKAEGVPTIERVGPFRVFFYSGDLDEPPHIHVERDDCLAKFWLDPVRRAWCYCKAVDCAKMEKIVGQNAAAYAAVWEDVLEGRRI